MEINLEEYIKKIGAKEKTKAKTYMEERITPFLSKIGWTNKTLEKDMTFFWSQAWGAWKQNESQTIKILEWASEKGVHPRAVASLFRKLSNGKK